MAKPKLIVPVVITLTAVLAMIVYIGIKAKNTALKADPQDSVSLINIQNLKSTLTRENATQVLENIGVEKSGFGTNSGGICFLSSDLSVNFQQFSSNNAQILQKGFSAYNQGRILSGKNRCIATLSGKNGVDTFSIDPLGNMTKVDVGASFFGKTSGEFFTFPTEKDYVLLDANSNKVNNIPNREKMVFAIAPVASSKYYAITNYDSEQNLGKLIFREIGKQDLPLGNAQNTLGLFANNNVALYVEQSGNKTEGQLINKEGMVLSRIANIDPDNIVNYKSGFLFITKPGGIESEDNNDSAIGYVDKDGAVHAIIGTQGSFSIGSISAQNNSVFAQEGLAIWKVDIDF